MIYVILLAAGNSRRFQGEGSNRPVNKLLHPFLGKPLFLHGFEKWRQAADAEGECQVIAVAREPEILKTAELLGFFPVESRESEKGVSYSIRAGINAAVSMKASGKTEKVKEALFPAVFNPWDRLVFSVSDQPLLKVRTLTAFLKAAKENRYTCISWKGERYNPVSFPPEAVLELLELKGDQGGKKVLKNHQEEIRQVKACREEEIKDVDSFKDMDDLWGK